MNGNDSAAVPSDTDVTQVKPEAEQARLAAEAGVVVVPGYQIESTLGRGGMGVVYKATQSGLNRVVALKMLIAGQYADSGLRARFLLEAESIAALEHPHIIRVFAFGEHGGHPYLAMEYLPGGTLAERIKKSGPLAAKEATELLAKLAEAVAHAHSRGVVHRDIKPLNVLLTAEGEPRLTDFGLAKVGRADQNLSVTGQVLGTPAYMAPEQAAGKVHEVGTAADVYALGAVLYDVLTGRPPFQGDSAAVTLQKVLTEEPQRPRKHNPSIPHDLETICLKCLEKDPARRYPTAQALADDLLRYLRGEPISVRPTGRLERGYKWVKRNKVVSSAAAAVFLALVVGAGVSLAFGLHANDKAEEAKRKQKDADDATEREQKEKLAAITARNDLKLKIDELGREREQRNRTLAKALIAPLASKGRYQSLTPYEQDALWQITEMRHESVPMIFVEEATLSPLACEQLECRVEYALHAVIGLDANRRDMVERLLLLRVRPGLKNSQTLALVRASSHWQDASPVLATEVATALTAALANATSPYARREILQNLSAVSTRLDPLVVTSTATVLARELTKETDPLARQEFVQTLLSLAARMNPLDATKVCTAAAESLLAALGKEAEGVPRSWMVAGLLRLVPHVDSVVAPELARFLVAELEKESNLYYRPDTARALSTLSVRLDPAVTTETCAAAARILATLAADAPRADNISALMAVIGYLDPRTAAKICAKIANDLVEGRGPLPEFDKLSANLSALTAHLDPVAATEIWFRAANNCAAAIGREGDAYSRRRSSMDLSIAAAHLDSATATALCTTAAETLLTAWEQATDVFARLELTVALTVVVKHLDSLTATRICDILVRDLLVCLKNEANPKIREQAIGALMALAPRMDADTTMNAVSTLLLALDKEVEPYSRQRIAEGLSALAVRVPSADAVRVLAVAMGDTVAFLTSQQFVQSLSAVAIGLPTGTRDRSRRATVLATGSFATPYNVLPSLALLHPHFHPQPRPLPAQELVELLKHPFCIGEARRAVLDALEFTYKRQFKDQWDFVEYAQKHQPQLDLLTPPKRPEAKP